MSQSVSVYEDLTTKASAGDQKAFCTLYHRHYYNVTGLVFKMLGKYSNDIDDIVQEVFLQVHKSLVTFREQSKFSTWLHRVTVNAVLMHLRSARSRPVCKEKLPEIVSNSILPDVSVDQRERVRVFSKIVDSLPEKKRVVFILHDLEGVSASEISKIVNAPILTVRTRLFYARRELRTLINNDPILATV